VPGLVKVDGKRATQQHQNGFAMLSFDIEPKNVEPSDDPPPM